MFVIRLGHLFGSNVVQSPRVLARAAVLYLNDILLGSILPLALKCLQLVPVRLWQRIAPVPNVYFCYHMVSNTSVAHVKHYPFLDTATFEADLRYLKERFRFVSYEQIEERQAYGTGPCDNSTCITFDDGLAQCESVVRPILLRHGATCIFFVITDLIDNRRMLWEAQASLCADAVAHRSLAEVKTIIRDLGLEAQMPLKRANSSKYGTAPVRLAHLGDKYDPQLRSFLTWLLTIGPDHTATLDQLCDRLGVDVSKYMSLTKPYLSTEQIMRLHADGFTIGAHSCSHPRLQDLSPADAEREIVESCRVIHNLTGQKSVPFAFPYFGGGIDRSWLEQLRRKYPFVGLFFASQGLRPDQPCVIQRIVGERIDEAGSIDKLLRRAWSKRLLIAAAQRLGL